MLFSGFSCEICMSDNIQVVWFYSSRAVYCVVYELMYMDGST